MRPYRTPEQHRADLESAGWTIVDFSAWHVEAWNPTATIRTIISFGGAPTEPAPAPPPPNIASATTPAKQLPLW
jgi:hypothetical protein